MTKVQKDPSYIKAYVERPLSEYENAINQIQELHKITIVNKSYSVPARKVIERNLL